MDEQAVTIETSNKESENAYRVKKKTFDLLPESEENLNKLMVIYKWILNNNELLLPLRYYI